MAEFKRKSKNPIWHSPIILIVVFCILVLFSFNIVKLIEKERETSKNKMIQLNKIEELRERETNLKADLDKLNTEEGIEDTIRSKFQVVKPGEKVVAIVDEEDVESEVKEIESHGFWSWIKNMFK